MFFIERGTQIIALVNAIIDSIAAIAKGSIGVAATLVENALAKAIPVAIGFLASLLGLGDISGTDQEDHREGAGAGQQGHRLGDQQGGEAGEGGRQVHRRPVRREEGPKDEAPPKEADTVT